MKKGFTLVELVIVIAIVIVLSVVSVPIYRSYVEKAKYSEGYALLGVILTAQKAYYSEYGNFYQYTGYNPTSYDAFLGIDVRGNKYFTEFGFGWGEDVKKEYSSHALKPSELWTNGFKYLVLNYNITSGGTWWEWYSANRE